MDREILFRGKRANGNGCDGEWIYGYGTTRDQIIHLDIYAGFVGVKVGPATVGQYTGLTDKNGAKIFEGDIIRWKHWDGVYHERHVQYDPEWNRFCVRMNGAESLGVNKHLSEDIEVIGNIHDNPELMGGEDDG